MFTAGLSFSLEQVPEFYGSMMSLTSATSYVGMALGAGVGGLTLLRFGYEEVGLFLGVLSIISALIFYFMVRDPVDKKSDSSLKC
jgi:predicted MFS family arabinose efflux permease